MLSLVKTNLSIFTFISLILSYLLFAPSAFAQKLIDCSKIQAPFNSLCTQTKDKIPGFIGALITFIFAIAVVIALFYLLFGAVRWINSGGDKAAIEGARGQIIAAIVGLVILFFAFLIFTIALAFFNVNINEIEVPTIPK